LQAAHVVTGPREVGFQVKDYDRTRPLVIDPQVSYGTLLGGGADEVGLSIAVDSSGNAYVCGLTTSVVSFPTTPGAYESVSRMANGNSDAFVTKMNPTGTALVYSTFLGGNDTQEATAIAVDSAGNAYVGGWTISINFPTTVGAFQQLSTDSCCQDNFVTKLNPTGSGLVYSTYLEGSDHESLDALAVDSSGNAYVTGFTQSLDFPTTPGAFQTTRAGGQDAFVTKLNPAGTGLVYSTYVGGTDDDAGKSIALDSSGSAYVAGYTLSTAFPTTAGSYRSPLAAGENAFAVKLNPAGSALAYSALLGGTGEDMAWGIAVDSQGSAYVAGRTQSSNFPVTPGAYRTTYQANDDIFVSKLNPAGSALTYSTFLGGSGMDIAYSIALDSRGFAYLTGITQSTDFPTTSGALKTALSDTGDGFVSQLNDTGTALLYSTYLGGNASEEGDFLTLDASGNVYILGTTASTDFPVTGGAFQTVTKSVDAFIVKMTGFGSAPPPTRTIRIISGNGQSGAVSTDLPSPLVVEVDDGSTPVAGVTVTFFPTNATLSASTVVTDAGGRASITVHLGSTAGTATITVSTPGATSVVFTETATGGPVVGQIAVTSAASYALPPVAPGMIAVIWSQPGSPNFIATAQHATSLPLPTSLGGVSVKIRDAGGTDRDVPLFDVYPTQINVLIPDGTQGGNATLTVTRSGGTHTGQAMIESVAPGLFSANSQGTGSAVGAVYLVKADGSFTTADLGLPINMGSETDSTIVVLYGTGLRLRTSLANVSARVGGQTAVVEFAGAQGSFVGLDQVNLRLPRSLRGMGDVPISLTVDGKTANSLHILMADVPQPPGITSISPTTGQPGQTINNFTLTGTNLTGGQIVWDNSAGLTLTNVNVRATSISAALSIAASAALGYRNVWVRTAAGESNHLSLNIVAPPAPTINSISPTSGDPGQTITTFTVTGSNLIGVTAVVFTPATGITVSNVNATATQVTATVSIAASANGGLRNVSVSSPAGSSNSLAFTIRTPPGPYEGQWSGTTSQGRAMSMSIAGNNVTAYSFGVNFPDLGSTCPTGVTTFSAPTTSFPIAGGSFSSSTVSGTFQSATQASGTINWSVNLSGCVASGQVTWTASPGSTGMTGNWRIVATSSRYGIVSVSTGLITQNGDYLSGTLAMSGTPCATSSTLNGTLVGISLNMNLYEAGQRVTLTGMLAEDGNSANGTYFSPSGGCTQGDFGIWFGTKTP
jgi:uncharacterized protein (TIGR03437 family)